MPNFRLNVLGKILLLGSLLLVFACSSSTNPDSQSVSVTFLPASDNLEAVLGEAINFQALRDPSGEMDIRWSTNNTLIGTDASLAFVPSSLGNGQVSVTVTTDDQNFSRSWSINTGTGNFNTPPNISYLDVNHGNEIGEIILTWPRVIPTESPIANYHLVYSLNGPISASNWDEATSLETIVENTDLDRHIVTYDNSVGFPRGAMVWLSIIAEDERGMVSNYPIGGFITPSFAWYISGTVHDETGLPLHNVIVDFGCATCRVNTNQAGEFIGGPFSSRDNIDLYTVTNDTPDDGSGFFEGYYDYYQEDIVPADDIELDIYLIKRYGIDPSCTPEIYSGDFLNYFMEMTKTRRPTPGRENRLLYKWESYPVPVYIPEYTNEHGLDMASLCLAGLELWNTIMGEDYFVVVDDMESAGIYFSFHHEIQGVNGRASMIIPNSYIGDVIPELVEVYIKDTNSSAQWIQEIAMHELCHAIGCADHAICNSPGYMMYFEVGGILNGNPLDAIHVDEQNLMRAIRYLPMGYDLNLIETSQ
jgi:hypothetical protein